MSGSYLLGIDAGTSIIKAAIFDREGRELAVAAVPHVIASPRPGWIEADMEQTWRSAASTVRAVIGQANLRGADIAAIGVSANMVGLWPIDAQGQPTRSAILWNDGRTQALLARLSAERPSFMRDIFASSGSVMQQGCTLPLLRWLREAEPEVLARTATLLCCKDWLRFKLTGMLNSEPTEASVMPGDARGRGYADSLFTLLGVADLRHLFPPIVQSEAVVGTVTRRAAADTGLHPGTPVVAGAGDVPAVALGVGAVAEGSACTILGTTCISGVVVAEPLFTPVDVGLLFCLPGGGWLRAFANIAGTTNLDWLAAQLCPDIQRSAGSQVELFAHLEALAAQSEQGARGIVYHPYLSSVGVIAPFVEPGARAQFFGLTIEHQRADIIRAVYEGVGLAIRDCYNVVDIPLQELRLSGGGTRSGFWCQLIADIVGSRIVVPASREAGALGAALLAATGLHWFASVTEAARSMVIVGNVYEPDMLRHARYEHVYGLYQDLRRQLIPLWQQRAALPTAL
jgi:sugar (pentulose or hexulose) kinase